YASRPTLDDSAARRVDGADGLILSGTLDAGAARRMPCAVVKRGWVRGVFGLLAVAGVACGAERAGLFGISGWKRVPSLTIVSSPGDPRIPAVREAVAFWNQTFAELGSPFRLGAITLVTGSIPDARMRD